MPNLGISPPDFSTPTGQMRALLGDTDAINVTSGVGEYVWFSDNDLGGFLTVYSGSVRRAAAQALRTVASSQALLLKKFSSDDLSVDGPAIAEALRKLAKDLDTQADGDEANVDIFELIPLATQAKLHPELAPFVFGKRYGIAEIGLDGSVTFSDGSSQDGGIIWGD